MNLLKFLPFGILPALVFTGCGNDATDATDATVGPEHSLDDFMNALSAFAATCETSDDLAFFSNQRWDLLAKWESCKASKVNFGSTKIEEKMLILEPCLDEVEKIWSMRLGNEVPLNERGTLIVNPITSWRVELASVSPVAFDVYQKIDEVRKTEMAKGVLKDRAQRLWQQVVMRFAPYLMKEIRNDCSLL